MDDTYCAYDEWTAPYLSYAVSLSIFIPLQIALLVNTLQFECVRCKQSERTAFTVKRTLTFTFIALIFVGLYWYLVDLFRFVIDPVAFSLDKNNALCIMTAYSPKVIPFVYFVIVFYQLLYRLELSFKASCLALSKPARICLYSITYLPALFCLPPLFFVFLPQHCRWQWAPRDFASWTALSFCDVKMNETNSVIMAICIVWVVVDNIVICCIFSWKLKRLLSLNSMNNGHNASLHLFKLKAVMIKNGILTVMASATTLINWSLWWLVSSPNELGGTFLYLDTFLNCFLIGLMFNYNDAHYKRLCKCCIRCCFQRCDKSVNAENREKRDTQLMLYLNNSDYHKYIQFF